MTESKFCRWVAFFTGVFAMCVVYMIFIIQFRGPGSIRFWTLHAIIDLMGFFVMIKSDSVIEETHITYLTIAIMAFPNVNLQFLVAIKLFRSLVA